MNVEETLRKVRYEAEISDKKVPTGLSFSFLFSVIKIFILSPLSQFLPLHLEIIAGLVVLSLFISRFLIVAAAVYVLSKNIKKHFERSKKMRAALILLAREKNLENTLPLLKPHYEATFYEKIENPLVYAFLAAIIPFASVFIVYALSKRLYNHHVKEATLGMMFRGYFEINPDFMKAGMKIKPRDNILYLFLGLVSGEIFLVYWYYILAKDLNRHFEFHNLLENALIELATSD